MEALGLDHFFVDEAGDAVLFNKRRRVIIGTEGVSRFFMVGMVYLRDPEQVRRELNALRAELLRDPYFAGVPSMEPSQRKTAVFFHAKNDLPEVRREVFKLLPRFNVTTRVAVRRKSVLAAEAAELFRHGYKLRDDMIYDGLVKWLILGRLNPDRHSMIAFAKRGKSDRLAALGHAIFNATDAEHAAGRGIRSVHVDQPAQSAGLQVADYYIWAVQRMFERREDRFFKLLAQDFELVMDLDDRRNRSTGEWYDQENALELEKIMSETG